MVEKTMAFLAWLVELVLNAVTKMVAGLLITFLVIAAMLASLITFVIYLVQ